MYTCVHKLHVAYGRHLSPILCRADVVDPDLPAGPPALRSRGGRDLLAAAPHGHHAADLPEFQLRI